LAILLQSFQLTTDTSVSKFKLPCAHCWAVNSAKKFSKANPINKFFIFVKEFSFVERTLIKKIPRKKMEVEIKRPTELRFEYLPKDVIVWPRYR
jgi:hypothetical protein